MTDHQHRDQDKPGDIENATDHRPADAGAPPWQNESDDRKVADQNPDSQQPPASQMHKQQRSQGMNHSGWEGKN